MAMTRRALIKAGVTAAGVPLTSHVGRAQPPGPVTGGIQFDISGLVLLQRWKKTKKLKAVMPDAKKSGLKDAHAPTLMMSYEDFDDQAMPDPDLYEPTVLRYGSETFLSWSLTGTRVWLGGVQNAFDTDPTPAMTFDDSTPTADEPTPIDTDAGWSPLHWFAPLGAAAGSPIKKPQIVTCEIVFTRGYASGRSPVTCAARYRKFEIDGAPERSCGNNLSILHPAPASGFATLHVDVGLERKVIPIRLRADRPARLIISHNPMTMHAKGHVDAYYRLVGKKGPTVKVKNHGERCLTSPPPAAPGVKATAGMASSVPKPGGHPPDDDCMSMLMEME